jgi:DivIVA domain-containing protein
VLGFLFFVLGILVVAVLLFLGASALLGRGETQPPAEPERSPVELPEGRPVTGDDVRDLRIPVAVRGYRMTDVDWLLEQFADALDERDEEIASLRARLREGGPGAPAEDGPATAGTTDVEDVREENEERSGA